MRRKFFILVFLSLLSMASQFVILKNGKAVVLKDDGTYEEVILVEREGKTVALKKDGTWESVPEKDIFVETTSLKKNGVPDRDDRSDLVKELIGKWESPDASLVYIFKKDGKLSIRQNGKWRDTTYKVDDVDINMRNIVVNVGEKGRVGFLSFGGENWVLHIDEDGKTLHNDSLKLKTFKDITLFKR